MIRKFCFSLFLLLLSFNAWAQRSPEDVGKEVFEALHSKDFDRIAAIAPNEEVIQVMMKKSAEKTGQELGLGFKAEDVVERMQMKMKAEFDDMLKSAKFEKVKLKKLKFDRIVEVNDNPESPSPMKAVVMAMDYKGKPVNLTYSVVQSGENWYYTGTLLSFSIFQQVRK